MGGKVKGYTLIEVAVVLAIISILMGLSVRYLINQRNEARLRETVNSVIQYLEETRRMSSSRDFMLGLEFSNGSNQIIRFRVDNNCANRNNIETFNLPEGVISNRDTVIIFDRMGYPRNASCGIGADRVVLHSQPLNITRSICINRYGRIRVVEAQTCPQD